MYHCPVYFFGTCFQTIPFSKKKKTGVLRQTTTNEWLNQRFNSSYSNTMFSHSRRKRQIQWLSKRKAFNPSALNNKNTTSTDHKFINETVLNLHQFNHHLQEGNTSILPLC